MEKQGRIFFSVCRNKYQSGTQVLVLISGNEAVRRTHSCTIGKENLNSYIICLPLLIAWSLVMSIDWLCCDCYTKISNPLIPLGSYLGTM